MSLFCPSRYGSLPPATRSQQAKLFNDPDSDFDSTCSVTWEAHLLTPLLVLVASDAIGMGLNLNIRRLVFSSMEKFDGVQRRFLNDAEIKQIAGRAGRYGGQYPEGEVTWYAESVDLIASLTARFHLQHESARPDAPSQGPGGTHNPD